ncbi:MAG: hypothetical protein ACRDRR_21210 [Pseudonocardiaceae bacterium]
MTSAREKFLVEGLIAALPSLRMADLFECRRDMFRNADLVTIATTGSEVIGALASRWAVSADGADFLHITSQFVGERHRQGHVFKLSWAGHFAEVCRRRGCPQLSVLKTYNPIVYCAMRWFTRLPGIAMYPDITAPAADPELGRRAGWVASAVAPGHAFSWRTGVIRGIGVPADLYPAMPMSSDPAVNDYFLRTTGPADRVLCMLTIPTRAAAGAVLRALGAPPVLPGTQSP